MDTDRTPEQEPAQPQPQSQAQVEDSDTFEHIKQGSDAYDAQTYGMVPGLLLLLLTKHSLTLCSMTLCTGQSSFLNYFLSIQVLCKTEIQLFSGTKITVAKCQ